MNFLMNQKIYLIFSLFSFFLVFFKLFCQIIIFKVPIDLTTLLLLNDSLYFPLIDSFSDFNFNPSYSEDKRYLDLISYPILGLIINLIFYKLFNIYSFIILEFLCVILFLSIFFKIFLKLNFSKEASVLNSFLIFFLPNLFQILGNFNFYLFTLLEINFSTFYSLRFPRPIISNLYLFGFLYFCLKIIFQNQNFKRNMIYISLLMSLSLHSFFYLFIFQSLTILLVYFYIFRLKVINFFLRELKFHIFLLSIIFVNFLIFQLQLINAEKDFIIRLGVLSLDSSQKIILFDYFVIFFFKIEFLSLLLLNSLFLLLNNRTLKVFYFFFISTILGTFIFILISNKGVDYYHFNNWIITSGILNLFISTLYLIKIKFFRNSFRFVKFLNIFTFLLILGIIFQNNSLYFDNIKKNSTKINQYNKIDNYFSNQKEDLKKKEILSLDHDLFLVLINNDFKNFSIVPDSFWTPKKDTEINKELFSLFNFFDLDQNYFAKFFENTLSGYRIRNSNTLNFFGRKYLANQLKIFDKKDQYSDLEQEYIDKHSPIITHQLIIPKNELKRLINDFENYDKKLNPSILILEKKSNFFKSNESINNNFCLDFSTLDFEIYLSKKIKPICS